MSDMTLSLVLILICLLIDRYREHKEMKWSNDMADREKVIEGLEHCRIGDCVECPYDKTRKQSLVRDKLVCNEQLTEDILELLKEEQETGHWIYLENCSNSGVYCSECHTKVFDNYPFKKKFSYFCPHCGTRMEGETERR